MVPIFLTKQNINRDILMVSLLIIMYHQEVHSVCRSSGQLFSSACIHKPGLVVMWCGRKAEHTQETHVSTLPAAVGLDSRLWSVYEQSEHFKVRHHVCCGFYLLLSVNATQCSPSCDSHAVKSLKNDI